MASRIKWLQPFVKNHAIRAEVLAIARRDQGDRRHCKYRVHEGAPECARTPSPMCMRDKSGSSCRTALFFFEARELAEELSRGYEFAVCSRSLELWDENGMLRIGKHHRGDGEWRWLPTNAHSVGVRTPLTLDECDEEQQINQDPEPGAATPQDSPPAQEDLDNPDAAKDQMDEDTAPSEDVKRQREEDNEARNVQGQVKRKALQVNKTL